MHLEVKSCQLQNEPSAALWCAGPGSAKMLQVRFPQFSSAGAFFEHFLADSAAFSTLDGNFPPWNDYTVTSNGELEQWNEVKTRKLRLHAHPVPPGFMPFKNPILQIEQIHQYQFLLDSSTGAEILQFQCVMHVRDAGGVPYADQPHADTTASA